MININSTWKHYYMDRIMLIRYCYEELIKTLMEMNTKLLYILQFVTNDFRPISAIYSVDSFRVFLCAKVGCIYYVHGIIRLYILSQW